MAAGSCSLKPADFRYDKNRNVFDNGDITQTDQFRLNIEYKYFVDNKIEQFRLLEFLDRCARNVKKGGFRVIARPAKQAVAISKC